MRASIMQCPDLYYIANRAHDLLKKCGSISHLKQIHAHVFRFRLHQSSFLASYFVVLYSSLSCSPPHHTRLVFSFVPYPSLLLFNHTIKSLSKYPTHCPESLNLYYQMCRSQIKPDNFTYPYLFNSCAALSKLNVGFEIHGRAIRSGFCWFIPVSNALVDMYGKCGELDLARKAFDGMTQRDIVSYNALLGAHARNGEDMVGARTVFNEMPVRNVISWNAMVVGHVNSGDLGAARVVFDQMSEKNVVTWTTMLVGYIKKGLMDQAKSLFDDMPEKTLICWTAMITGYAQSRRPSEALSIFQRMKRKRVKPDAFTLSAIVSAAAQLGCPDLADWITCYVEGEIIDCNEHVLTALIDMNAKCGNIDKACMLFAEVRRPDVYPYSALITGMASHGHGLRALEIFKEMQRAKVEPDHITFVGVLTACRHAGLLEEGMRHWDSMIHEYKIEPDADHYACLVDMWGRAGRLDQAYSVLCGMPKGPRPVALGALLGACRTYGDVEIGHRVAGELFELEPDNTGNYMLLSSIYAERGQWNEASAIRKEMEIRIESKLPGSSWIMGEKIKKYHGNLPTLTGESKLKISI